MKNEPFIIERTYNAPIEKVWKAITDREQMKEWYFDIKEFKPEPGFEFQFEGKSEDKTYLHFCKVTEVVNGRKLSYSWRYEGYEGNSVVSFELFPKGNKTTLKLTHEGIETFPANIADFAKESFVAGWTEITGESLKKFVETDTIKKSMDVNASPAKVWDVLMKPENTRLWANAFGEGVYVETNWSKGSEVLWKDKEGKLGAKGVVAGNDYASLLKVNFFDDVNSAPSTPTGEYSESYVLAEKDGGTTISIEAGPLSVKYVETHAPLWDKALTKLKELSEE